MTSVKSKSVLRSFKPFADSNSKIIILGTMPGPMALAKQEYYGFTGNHFWKILFRLFNIGELFKKARDVIVFSAADRTV